MTIIRWYVVPYENVENINGEIKSIPKYTNNDKVIKYSGCILHESNACLILLWADSEYHNQLIQLSDVTSLSNNDVEYVYNQEFNVNLICSQIYELFGGE